LLDCIDAPPVLELTLDATSASLGFEPAPVWRRFAALCYDLLLVTALVVCFTLLVLAVRLGAPVPPGSWWFPLAILGLAMTFFCGFWVHGGQTVGMRAWRIRVVRDDGSRLGWPRAAARFAAGFMAAVPAGLGLWWGALDRNGRGWHDRLTRTRVIRVPPRRAKESA
jgi:uncharacterized RDD family membrane protein YckC